MAAENESPSKEPSARGRGRGGRGGRRGRGGGRGASNSASVSKAAASSRGGRGGSRRGRAKTFSDSRVQAAYERQRDLKAVYQAVAHALKPALQELAERSIDELLQQPTIHKQAAEYAPIVKQLRQNLEERIAQHTRRLQSDLQLAENTFTAEKYVADQEFQNGVEDVLEEFWEAQQNRFRILHALHKKELPVDVRDDQYEYKVITDTELDRDFNIYECYKYGKLVPYPSRVRGTEMWRRAREADAAAATNAAAAAASASVSGTSAPAGRGRGRGRGVNKRRAAEQPDGQPTPKRSTRGMDDTQLFAPSPLTPAPSKGLLASAAESHLEEGGDEESVPASPEPPNLTNGSSSSTNAQGQEPLSARDRSPPLPKNAGEPDDYGVRVYSQRPAMRDKGMNSRVVAPPLFKFDEWDIGFRDSSNDSTRGHTRAKRCKYLDKPNSNAMHFDHWCNGYDFSSMDPEELDEDLIKKHRVHPKWGIFLPDSQNDQEQGDPSVMPGRPVVFIANPSGRLSHTSRSFQATINHRNVDDAPWRGKMGSSLLRFCKLDDVDLEDISVTDYLPTDEEWKAKSLKTAMKELKGRPEFKEAIETEESTPKEETPAETEDAKPQLSLLTYAAAYIEASNTPRPVPATPKQSRYDAIRDVFTDAKPTPAPPAAPEPDRVALNFLAELCNIENRLPVPAGSTAPYEVPPQPMPTVAPYQEPVPVDSYVRGPPHAEQEVPPPIYGQQGRPAAEMPIDNSYSYAPIQHSGPVPIQAAPPARGLSSEPPSYRPYHEQPHLAPAPPPPAGPPHVQEYAPYPPPAGYAYGEPREVQMAPSRSMEGGYAMHGGPGGYPSEPPSYPPSIWAQHGTPAPPPPPPQSMPHGHAPPPSHYASRQPPPPSQSRMSFSQNGSAEPLPPLRPPRAASTQPMPEEPMHDPGMHQPARASTGGFYPLAPSRPYGVDSRPPLQPIATDRILPSPQQAGHGYMTSPQQQQGYGQSIMSPTYGNQPMGPGAPQVVQSPPGTPQGPPGSAHRHRSTPSGSSDAGSNKYRKLQPAPIPAHRAGWSKQELKTIPYDVKDMGNSAALPSSGPTQIRGWNVNQHRKRGKAEKQDKSEPAADRDDAR